MNESSLDEKKRRRLERNRESARECRKRKKDKILTLKQQLALLEADNLQLRLKLQIGPEAAKLRGEKIGEITRKLEKMIHEGNSEVEIMTTITELQEKYSDYGRDRRSAIAFHIQQLRRSLQPTQTTKTILWLLDCAPNFFDTDGTLKPRPEGELADVWYDLVECLSPSLDQSSALVNLALSPIANDGGVPLTTTEDCSDESDRMLNRLDELALTKNETLDQEMNEIQSILSASQIARFILWIHQNPACMQMLEALWPHLTRSLDSTMDSRSCSCSSATATNISSSSSLSIASSSSSSSSSTTNPTNLVSSATSDDISISSTT